MSQFDFVEAKLKRWMFEPGIGRAVFGEEMNLVRLVALIDRFDSASPSVAVTVVDLTKVKQGFLDRSATSHPAVLHDAPVAVFLTILDSLVRTQKNRSMGRISHRARRDVHGVGLHHRYFRRGALEKSRATTPQKGEI
jgi:hypothetical protein